MHQDSDTPSVKGKNYADFSREELIAEINKLKKTKKYGLVWEHKTEEVIENFKNGQQPYLEEVQDKHIENAPGEPTNLIIEGDNFDALSILNYTHAGKIDVIYIDPPYNTGNKDFIYNDDYVDSEDEFRHSKWLSFMEPRLKIAKALLKDDGVIYISIGNDEHSALVSLCDSIFGKDNFVEDLVWTNKEGGGSSDSKFFKRKHEYIICYCKNIMNLKAVRNVEIEDYDRYRLSDEHEKERGKFQLVKLASASLQFSDSLNYELEAPDGTLIMPHDNTNKDRAIWRWSKKRYAWGVENDFIVWKKDRSGIWQVYTKQYSNCDKDGNLVERTKKPMAVIDSFSSTQGSNLLFNILGRKTFSYPKPVELINWLIKRFSYRDEIILDFFAGSGTTGQAVLELNKEDSGHRQFILCTNNGDKGPDSTKIAEDITYPRIKTVITGERQDGSRYSDGIPANLRYYKIDHRQKKDSVDATRQDIVNYLEDIIKIKENTFGAVEANEDFSLYQNPEQYLGMVFDPFSLEEVIEKLTVVNADKRPVKLYVFSYSRDAFEEDFGTDFEIEFVAMPEGLLKTYVNIIEDLKKEDA